MTTPGNSTTSLSPRLITLPPKVTKNFLLTSAFCELRCQCPMFTPISLGGNATGCAVAALAAIVKANAKTAIVVFMAVSSKGLLDRWRQLAALSENLHVLQRLRESGAPRFLILCPRRIVGQHRIIEEERVDDLGRGRRHRPCFDRAVIKVERRALLRSLRIGVRELGPA